MKPKRSNIPRGKRKRLTLRLTMAVWKRTQQEAFKAGMEVNTLIEATAAALGIRAHLGFDP